MCPALSNPHPYDAVPLFQFTESVYCFSLLFQSVSVYSFSFNFGGSTEAARHRLGDVGAVSQVWTRGAGLYGEKRPGGLSGTAVRKPRPPALAAVVPVMILSRFPKTQV